jgi:DNA-binding transcriptional LysR family regulator
VELRHLRYFIAVAEHLNFSRAAEELRTAQPSLSQQIRALEDELKMKLFERTHRYVALTVEGALLLPEARDIVQRVDGLSTLREISTEPRGPLRIASITAATIAVLPQVLPSYREAFPNVQLSVESGTVDDNSRALVERRVDVAFLRAPLDDPRLDGALVAEEQICVALPNGHPLCSRKKVPIRALDGADMVGMRDEFTGDFNKTMDAVLREHDVASRARVQTGSLETMLGLVASGMGIAICSATVKFMLVSGLTLRPLEPRQTLKSLWLAWRRDRENLPVIRSFRDQVIDAGLTFAVTGRN